MNGEYFVTGSQNLTLNLTAFELEKVECLMFNDFNYDLDSMNFKNSDIVRCSTAPSDIVFISLILGGVLFSAIVALATMYCRSQRRYKKVGRKVNDRAMSMY